MIEPVEQSKNSSIQSKANASTPEVPGVHNLLKKTYLAYNFYSLQKDQFEKSTLLTKKFFKNHLKYNRPKSIFFL